MFPAFKFQEEKYAKSMLSDGNVHLSNISIFRDSSRFTGQILDKREGIATLHNGIPTTKCHNYAQNSIHAFPHKLDVIVSDAYVFCCTKYFLSDSLTWAISEGKQCCVLITDVDEYINRVSLYFKTSLEFKSAKECQYIGRDFVSTSATPYDNTNYFIQDELNAAFIKPKEYASQRELRLLWTPKSDVEVSDFLNDNVETTDLLIPVRFHDFDESFSSFGNCTVGARILTKNGRGNAEYQIQVPNEVFTPVIHSNGGEKMLGFLSTSNHLSGGRFNGGHTGIFMSDIGCIVCNVYLSDIESIEIFTQSA
ncbi:hypothetical protein OPW19_18265 [Vibrio europaeus]|uniref:hypothetical protein n=1 Tax=Vibrio europaeus TaxID=300876 RepID=UPI00233F77B4|nr:hypothetical protein [Vibrio europaeus]MDC5821758.1 hypothetical protein [Vibrio europaeus]